MPVIFYFWKIVNTERFRFLYPRSGICFCYVYKVPNCITEGVSRENIEFGLEFGNNTRSHTLPKETKTNFKERGKVILEICGQHIQQIPKRRMIPTHANVHTYSI